MHQFREYPNPTGINPRGIHLLIEMDPVPDRYEGSGIYKNPSEVKIEENAQTRGRLVACAPYAWWSEDYLQPEAQPGDRVIIAKYCGVLHDWNGRKYRLIKDCEIMATVADAPSVVLETSEADTGDEA